MAKLYWSVYSSESETIDYQKTCKLWITLLMFFVFKVIEPSSHSSFREEKEDVHLLSMNSSVHSKLEESRPGLKSVSDESSQAHNLVFHKPKSEHKTAKRIHQEKPIKLETDGDILSVKPDDKPFIHIDMIDKFTGMEIIVLEAKEAKSSGQHITISLIDENVKNKKQELIVMCNEQLDKEPKVKSLFLTHHPEYLLSIKSSNVRKTTDEKSIESIVHIRAYKVRLIPLIVKNEQLGFILGMPIKIGKIKDALHLMNLHALQPLQIMLQEDISVVKNLLPAIHK